MSDTTQDSKIAPSANEVGDGGANIDAQVDEDAPSRESAAPSQGDSGQRKSAQKQADGDFPIMT